MFTVRAQIELIIAFVQHTVRSVHWRASLNFNCFFQPTSTCLRLRLPAATKSYVFLQVTIIVIKMDFDQSYWSKRRKIRSNAREHMVASFGLHSDSQLDLEHEATCQSIESETVNYDPLVERNEDIATEPNLDVEGDVHDQNSPSVEDEANDSIITEFCDIPEPSDEWAQFLTEVEQEFDVESSNEMSENENENSETSVISDSNLVFELGQWASSNSISVTALSSLLGMLRVFHPSLPKDPRTLLKTSCQSNLKLVEGGAYFHFGIASCLSKSKELLDFQSQNSDNMADPLPALSLQMNFGGLPLCKL